MVEVSVDGEYVVGSLVVGYEYVGCMGVDVLAPFDSDLDHGHDTEKARPLSASYKSHYNPSCKGARLKQLLRADN